MQTKINAFFKPQNQNPNQCESKLLLHQNSVADDDVYFRNQTESTSKIPEISSRIPKNKRSYAQLHLDLGQSDFLFHSCSTCGFKYACGDEADEKLHKEVHKEYTQGIPFKGCENERVVYTSLTEASRVILVLDGDPPAHKKRVKKVLQMMEVDLGSSGSLIHKLCKVYLYISQRRIAGCLVVEPISEAYKVICKSVETPSSLDNTIAKKSRSNSSILQFGGISLQREAKEKSGLLVKPEVSTQDFMGAVFLEREAVPVSCGIRAIWVASAMRRKHIATQLLDTARKSFSEGIVLDTTQLAFSDPTSTGKALASQYCGTPSFLAYRAGAASSCQHFL